MQLISGAAVAEKVLEECRRDIAALAAVGKKPGLAVETLRQRLLTAFDQAKIRVIPREDQHSNRLALRRDIGHQYKLLETLLAQ